MPKRRRSSWPVIAKTIKRTTAVNRATLSVPPPFPCWHPFGQCQDDWDETGRVPDDEERHGGLEKVAQERVGDARLRQPLPPGNITRGFWSALDFKLWCGSSGDVASIV